jgi:HEAT repeat protein
MDPLVGGAAVSAVSEVIATAVVGVAGRSWRGLRQTPEARAVHAAMSRALVAVLRKSVREQTDDDWLEMAAREWRSAFTDEVVQALIAAVIQRPGDNGDQFAALARNALQASGCDLKQFDRTFEVDYFLGALPDLAFEELKSTARSDSGVRQLVDQIMSQRADARSTGSIVTATPREFRGDVLDLLRHLDVTARTARLPAYLPVGADVVSLARRVRVRDGLRTVLSSDGGIGTGQAYLLPVERVHDEESVRPWREVVDEFPCMVVLGDPGLGKSWLIRTETHRICGESLQAMARGEDVDAVLIPLPVRCDQLVAASGVDLAEAATSYLVALERLPERSRVPMQNRIRAGGVVLLMDALDELSASEDRARLNELLRAWVAQADMSARCIMTSRIADYAGSPLAGAHEVELQAFTADDVADAVHAWSMSQAAESRLMNRLRDPAIAGMARVPLLLALLCSLTAQLPDGEELPATRIQLYKRILRWFLTRVHRADDRPGRPELRNTDVDGILEILYPLAFHFATRPDGWVDLMPGHGVVRAVRAAPSFHERQRPAWEIVRELSVEAGVLVAEGDPSEGRDARYLFLHRTFAEYLVACHLAELTPVERLAVVDKYLWFNPAWAEVIPLLGGLLEVGEARQLVEYLLGQDADPFHYASFMAVRVLAERPDLDRLLPSRRQRALTHLLIEVLSHPLFGSAAVRVLVGAARLSEELVQSLLGCMNCDQVGIRLAALQVLADREEPGVLDTLRSCLNDQDPEVRQLALWTLAGQDGPGVVAGLLSRLEDQDPDVRRTAVNVLSVPAKDGRLSWSVSRSSVSGDRYVYQWSVTATVIGREGSEVTQALLLRLNDANSDVRRAALTAVARRRDPVVTQKLLSQLDGHGLEGEESGDLKTENSQDSDERPVDADECRNDDERNDPFWMREVIRALADRPDSAVTEKLLALLDDDRVLMERDEIIRVLLRRLEPRVAERLLGLLESEDPWMSPWMRQEVIDALAGSGECPIVGALAVLPDVDVEHRSVQLPAPAGHPGGVEDLLPFLQADDWQVRQPAFQMLKKMNDPKATEALQLLLAHNVDGVRYDAIEALADHEDIVMVEALLPLVHHEDPWTRRRAIEALANRESPGVIDALLSSLQDEDDYVQEAALKVVAGREEPGTVEVLLPLLARQNWSVLHEVTKALAKRRDPEALRALLSLLKHPDRLVHREVIDAIADRFEPEVTEALLSLLDDQDWFVSYAAREAVAGRWAEEDPQILLDRLDHQHRPIRLAAMKALIDRENADDLMALTQRVRVFRPAALEEVYEAAESLTVRLYLRLPSEDRATVIADLGWLTTAVMHTEFI